jgi:hypothetical protein
MLNRNWSCNCKKIVENHNGEITVKSKLNKGTTFDIYLPKTKKLMENQTFRILLADDDEGDRLILQMHLRK